MIKQIADESTAQLYLCHSPKSLAGKSYIAKDFDKLYNALKIMRLQLQPMFDKWE